MCCWQTCNWIPVLQRTLQGDVFELPSLPCNYWERARCTTNVARPRLEGRGPAGSQSQDQWGNKDKDNDNNQGGDIPAWMFRRSNQKTEKSAPKERDSKKKLAQPKENDDPARRNVKVKEGH